jgi:hypothetical protein
MSTKELYCKIYVDTDQDRTWLLQQVAEQCLGVVAGRTVSAPELVVDISRNEDYDPVRAQSSEGFVHFPYYLDVEPVDGIERTSYIDAVRNLLLGFSQSHIRAVAACDFENELPEARI